MSSLAPGPGLQAAVVFATLSNRGGVQRWMLWPGWAQHVGCGVCAGEGPDAECWGIEGCHRFENDCGCHACAAIELDELERHARSLAPDLSRPRVGTLRDELVLVDAQVEQPRDRSSG